MEKIKDHTRSTANITGWRYRLLEMKMLSEMARVAWNAYSSPRLAWLALCRQVAVHLEYKRICHLTKAVYVGARVFVQMGFPRLRSEAATILAINELSRNTPIAGRPPGLNILFLAITKKCSLRCAHCFEWDALNHREQLSADDVLAIVRKFQVYGVASIELSGGEPLNRFDDLLRILRESDTEQSEFWLITSGYRLTPQRAAALREAGLVGAAISLDHWNPAEHDRFRGMEGSFDWARQAVLNARSAGLAVCLSLTAIREFCTPDHLWRYAYLAQQWGANFIRIQEPRAVGHFAGQDVELKPAEIAVLEEFVQKIQCEKACRDYPMVEYYPAYQRRMGCSGAGKRFMYVDTDGDMHACPFCQNKCGNAVHEQIESGMEMMEQASGCHTYKTV